MESYTIIFVETDVAPAESDYYYKDGKLKRVFTFPEAGIKEKNYGSFKKAVPFICSNSIALNDSTLHSKDAFGPAVEGVVNSMDFEKNMATLTFGDGLSKIVSFDECYYPIAEVVNTLEPIKDRQSVNESDLNLVSFCPTCNKPMKRIGDCQIQMESCERNNTKTYAFIEIKP